MQLQRIKGPEKVRGQQEGGGNSVKGDKLLKAIVAVIGKAVLYVILIAFWFTYLLFLIANR